MYAHDEYILLSHSIPENSMQYYEKSDPIADAYFKEPSKSSLNLSSWKYPSEHFQT